MLLCLKKCACVLFAARGVFVLLRANVLTLCPTIRVADVRLRLEAFLDKTCHDF